MGRLLVVVFGALCAGCPSGPPSKPEPPDLKDARALGRTLAAVEKYAALYSKATQDDPHVIEARAQILVELAEIGAPGILAAADPAARKRVLELVPAETQRDLVTAALGESARAMSRTVEAEQHLSCSQRQAALLRRKIADPSLRRWQTRTPFEELGYRRSLLEAIAAYELFALVRGRNGTARSGHAAAAALDELAAACKALADHPATVPEAVKYWDNLSMTNTTLALQVRARPNEVKSEAEMREMVESDVDAHLRLGATSHDLAVRRIAGGESLPLVLQALEDSLRHAILACEAMVRPTPRQEQAMKAALMDVDQLAQHALKR